MGILDIQSGDISALSPGDLQELVGRLSQAELMKRGLSPTGATWGGNINARDGGVDVLVNTEPRISESGFIPKGVTAFQVKQTEMPPAKIKGEMLDGKGRLKQAIAEVFQDGGAYIVVSGKDSVTPLGIDKRKQSMRDAASACVNDDGFLDFYGNDRIAQWVRCHSSLALWVREQKREARYGWKPYGDWSYPPLGDTDAGNYITKKGMVLYHRGKRKPLSITKGINLLRKTIRENNFPVRIVGLAGSGKTRLVQALFDLEAAKETTDEAPLNKYEAVYVDSGKGANPSPVHFAEMLVAKGDSSVLIVDNCDGKLHHQLVEVCRVKGSRVKLVTVDLDVRQDIPLETDAFELICEKGEMVEELLERRHPQVSFVNRETIARLCGGNARMALILADAVQRVGSANLNDENFLDCLFWQRHGVNEKLKQTAEVCSLLYSFGVAGDAAGELEMLASLVGRTPDSLFGDVGKLVERNIAQARGNMRAILPEALANRFAADALKRISDDRIVSVVTKFGEQVLKSFSRRLGDLHESDAAQEIAKKWLSPGGYLDAQGGNMSHRQMEVLENIAPISPRTTMEFIQRAEKEGVLSPKSRHFGDFARLLFHLAYDEELFGDATGVLCRMAMLNPRYDSHNKAFYFLSYLFQISLSGTHATPQQRLDIVRELTKEGQPEEKWQLGLHLLSSALKTRLSSSSFFGFGARARDFGYRPQGEDARDWFASFINHAADLAVSETPAAPKAAKVLADHFRDMWRQGMDSTLKDVADRVKAGDNWHEMALAVISTIRFDGKKMTADSLARLNAIRESFAPEKQNLQNRFRMFFTDNRGRALSFADFSGQETSAEKVRDRVHALGVEIAGSKCDFEALLPKMLGGAEYGDRFSLGRGIADGCGGNYQNIWGGFRAHLPSIEKQKRNFGVPMGFINSVAQKAPSVAIAMLEQAIEDEVFAPAHPNLETSAQLREGAPARLKKSLAVGVAPIRMYAALGWGRYHEKFDDADMVPLIRLIAKHPEGTDTALEILSMRFYDVREDQYMPDDSMRKCGRDVVLGVDFSVRDSSGSMSYNVGKIIDACFRLPEAVAESRKLCRKLMRALKHNALDAEDYIFTPLARWQAKIFLDEFVVTDDSYYAKDLRNAVSEIETDTIIEWCQQAPEQRCHRAALVVDTLQDSEDGTKELTPIARYLVENAPDKTKVLDNLLAGMVDWSWGWDTPVQVSEEELALFAEFSKHSIPEVAEWARQNAEEAQKRIQQARGDASKAGTVFSPQGFERR